MIANCIEILFLFSCDLYRYSSGRVILTYSLVSRKLWSFLKIKTFFIYFCFVCFLKKSCQQLHNINKNNSTTLVCLVIFSKYHAHHHSANTFSVSILHVVNIRLLFHSFYSLTTFQKTNTLKINSQATCILKFLALTKF